MSFTDRAIRYWRMGQYDTKHIAEKLKATEAEVYAVLSHRNDPPPKVRGNSARSVAKRLKPRKARRAAHARKPAPAAVARAPRGNLPYSTYYPNRFARKGV